MKLSVIVPVYNVEKFLPRCLDSLLRQGMEVGEYEIICVNDGSPDNSAQILSEYEQEYPDIFKVIIQENRGLGGARNTGMKAAQGEYISFIDSDDYVVDGAFRYLYDKFCTGQKPDVLNFCYRHVFTDGTTLADPDAKPDGEVVYDGDGTEEYNREKIIYVWDNFFRRDFLLEHHIQFEIVVWEDDMFNFDVYRFHPHLVRVSCNINRYEQFNATSIMRTVNKERVFVQLNDLYYNMITMRNYLQSEENPDLAPAARRAIRSFVAAYANKMGHIPITLAEWKRYTRLLRQADIAMLKDNKGLSIPACIIQWLKYYSLRYYMGYCINYWLYKYVFDRWLRKEMIKN